MKLLTLILLSMFGLDSFGTLSMEKCPMKIKRPPKLDINQPCVDKPTDCKTNPRKLKYRAIDGTCNNLDNPRWGAGYYKYARLVAPNYGDSVYSMPVSKRNRPLPNPRLLSNEVFREENVPDPKLTLLHMQFGQYVAHDLGAQIDKTDPSFCCSANGTWNYCDPKERECASITIFKKDPVFPQSINCMDFVRSVTDHDVNCKGGPKKSKLQPYEQMNAATAYLDHSPIYGASLEELNKVRLYHNGLLKNIEIDGIKFPSLQLEPTDCAFANESCFVLGDSRANSNPGLFMLHTFFYNEHNKIAENLAKLNPSWDDDMLFETARKINIGILQSIIYDEHLPLVLDENTLKSKKIVKPSPSGKKQYVNDYDPYKKAGAYNEFSTAAHRFFHSQIQGYLKLLNDQRNSLGTIRISDCLDRSSCLLKDKSNVYKQLGIGLCSQAQQSSDINFDTEIKHFAFRADEPFGQDLRAIDIMRARDHGLATYQSMREFCGLPEVIDWEDLEKYIPSGVAKNLSKHYDCVDDLELAVAGSLEYKIPGSTAGETFSCIIAHQFNHLREGDRFFYENSDTQGGCEFTLDQIDEIKKVKIAKIFCNNLPGMTKIQRHAFELQSKNNPLVDCKQLPYIDFSKWKDFKC